MKNYALKAVVMVELNIDLGAEDDEAAKTTGSGIVEEMISEWESACEWNGNVSIGSYAEQSIEIREEKAAEENCVLNECVQRGADTDWIVAWASRGPVLVQFENLDEGHCGDYDPDDPEDENLLRFTVYHNGEQVNDASYCTNIRADADRKAVKKAAERILREVYDPVMAGYSVKKLCEGLSWIELEE